MGKQERGVFFDCWNTLITFEAEDPMWIIMPLKKHAIHSTQYHWDEIFEFADNFLKTYYRSHSLYEISDQAFLRTVMMNYHIELDCSIEQAADEIMDGLSPKPVEGITDFLDILLKEKEDYFVLSNTIYSADKTREILERILPSYHFPHVIASKDLGVKKPNPVFFQTGCRYYNKNIKESIYIGDAYFQDVYGSYNAGFYRSIWLNWMGKKEVEQLINHPGLTTFEHIEVNGYQEVIRLYQEGKLWR